jgi:hypothetical protein
MKIKKKKANTKYAFSGGQPFFRKKKSRWNKWNKKVSNDQMNSFIQQLLPFFIALRENVNKSGTSAGSLSLIGEGGQ